MSRLLDIYRLPCICDRLCMFINPHFISQKSGQEARAAGCHTSAQAERYIGQKRKNEAEESTCRLRRVSHLKGEPDSSPQGNALESSVLDSIGKDSTTAGQDISNSLDCWDISAFPGADLLSETVRILFPNPTTNSVS